MTLTIRKIKDIITPICKQYNITAAYLFGSYARGDFTPSSDVDIRIDCGKSNKLKGLFGVSGLRLDLEDALKKSVDLLTWVPSGESSKCFRDNMLRDEVQIYGVKK
jgi:predicted nucleotidyltransferase